MTASRVEAQIEIPASRHLVVLRPGLVEYDEGEALQLRCLEEIRSGHRPGTSYLILLQHPPILTIGRSGTRENILADAESLAREGIRVREINRGGDVTYHGPGQIVGYPILSLREHGRDVHRYLRRLEAVIIAALNDFGIAARRRQGLTGVWVGHEKIASIGIAVRRWIAYHGFALNVDPNLAHFRLIHPCGIPGLNMTSMRRLLGRPVNHTRVEERLIAHFSREFQVSAVERT